jgi:hypothetical protein
VAVEAGELGAGVPVAGCRVGEPGARFRLPASGW